MKAAWHTYLAAGLVLGTFGAGCEPKPEVFDLTAIDTIEKLVVVPMASPNDPSAGAILSSLIAVRLEEGRWGRFRVVEAPALWRIAAAAQPELSAAAAAQLAGKMGAQAVLTGSTTHATSFGEAVGVPDDAKKKKEAEPVDFAQNFATRQGDTQVRVEILRADGARPVYVYTIREKGLEEADLLRRAAEKAVKPLEQHLEKTRGKRKEVAK